VNGGRLRRGGDARSWERGILPDSRLVASLLFQVEAFDLTVYATVTGSMLAVAALSALTPGVDYPRPFIFTTRRDDRVHPGHARKMAALMESLGRMSITSRTSRVGTARASPPSSRRSPGRSY
jgi:hypothetical protein